MTLIINVPNDPFNQSGQEINQPKYKSRFLSRVNHSIYTIPTKDVLYFSFEDNSTIITTDQNRSYVIDYSLDSLEKLIDPKFFFRINRKVLLRIESIKKINLLSKSRIEVILKNEAREIVSRAKSSRFKDWLEY